MVICTEGFGDIVFYQRVFGPTVNGEVAIAVRHKSTYVVDNPKIKFTSII
jgi:hypothetical protein